MTQDVLSRAARALILVAAVLIAGCSRKPEPPAAATTEAEAMPSAVAGANNAGARKPLYWYDPMVPDQRFDKPGKSPFMDMQLVPKYGDEPAASADDAAAGSVGLRIDPRTVQNLGIRVANVERGPLARTLRATGVVAVDEHRIESVQVRAAGWVETLAVRAAGDPVRRGALLARVYAPELLAAQQEFLLAQRSGDAALREAAKSRLALFGLSSSQIERVAAHGQAERGVDYHAPFDGYVMELGARQGAAVTPGMTLFQLASLDTVWVNVEVPEAQAAWINAGDRATLELPSRPGESRPGKVEYVYPELTAGTRTQKLRVQIDNRGGALRPGMYASVTLTGAPRAEALTVPSEAVIRTGTRSVVLVAEAQNRFRPVAVKIGAEAGDRSEVLEGLTEGQQVVASGQFLIDSEASLRSALDRLGDAPAPAAESTPTPGGMEHMEHMNDAAHAGDGSHAP